MLFPVDKKLVFAGWNEGLAEKCVPVEEKAASTGNSWLLFDKMEENVPLHVFFYKQLFFLTPIPFFSTFRCRLVSG